MVFKTLIACVAFVAVVALSGAFQMTWGKIQFSKNTTVMEGTIVSYRPVPTDAPPGSKPSAIVRLDDGRDVEVRFPFRQRPLVPDQKLALTIDVITGAVSPK